MNEKETRERVKLLEETLADFWAEIVMLCRRHKYDLNGHRMNNLFKDFKKAMRFDS